MKIRDKDLSQMDEATRSEKLKELAEATRRLVEDEDINILEKALNAYEVKYGISTEQMQDEVSSGTREETAEICAWLLASRRFNLLVDAQVLKMIGYV